MIQCTICEDWLHASHLEATLPNNDQYSEMICKACMEVNEFLYDYSYLAVNVDGEDIDVTLNETVTVEDNMNEQNEILHNASLKLPPVNQETSECENINITMEISNENEVMQNGISSNTTNNIEKESIASLNGSNMNGIVVESSSNNEPENKEMNNSCISREGEETRDATVTDKTDKKIEADILNINECAVLNTLEKDNVSMEIEESQEPQQKCPDNSNKECLSGSTSLIEEAIVNTTTENGSISDPNLEVTYSVENEAITTTENESINDPNDFNLKESNTECNEQTKSLEVACSVENEANTYTENGSNSDPKTFNLEKYNKECNEETSSLEVTCSVENKAETCMENESNSDPNKFNLEESNTESNETKNVEVTCSVENGAITTTENGSISKPNEFNLKESNIECNEETMSAEVTCNDENETKTIEHSEDNVKIDNSNRKSTDEYFQKIENNSPALIEKTNEKDLIQSSDICNGVDVDLKYLVGNDPDKKDLLETKQTSSEVDTTLNHLESNQPISKIDPMEYTEKGTPNIHLQSTEMSGEEATVLKNSENNKSNVEEEETDKMYISEFTETNITIDNQLNNLTDIEACTKTEEQSAETIGEQTDKQEISQSTEVSTDVDNILNNLEDSELRTNNEDQCRNTINKETEKKDISEITAADTNIETTLNSLDHSVIEDKTADQPAELMENETDKQDVLEPIKVDNSINVTLNKLEDSTSEANLEKDDTDKIDINVSEESVDQSDTLERATRELLELTSDMVEESEENTLLGNDDCADANKDMNSSEILSESSNLVETDKKEYIDTENTTETGEYTNGDNISQLKQTSCNNVLSENGHKRKYNEENADVEVKKAKFEEKTCIRPKRVQRIFRGATFWPSEFRQKLCTCNECLTMYKDLRLLFLLDPEDTVTAYETLGKEKIDGTPTTQYEKGLQALSSLDRVQQINALTEYNIMRDKLLDFLKSFKERKVVVKEEDIRAFFAGMKPKREPDGVYFCR